MTIMSGFGFGIIMGVALMVLALELFGQCAMLVLRIVELAMVAAFLVFAFLAVAPVCT